MWYLCTCCVMYNIIPRKPCDIGRFWTKLQIKKWAMYQCVFENAKNGPFFDFKTQKMVFFFIQFLHLCDFFLNFSKKISDLIFFSKNFKNIWIGIFKNIEIFESSNYDFKADFGKLSFFVKPKWFHGGFKFIILKPPLTQGGFKRFWRFFFFRKSLKPQKRPNFGQNSPYVGFQIYQNI